MSIKPEQEDLRLRQNIKKVEDLFEIELSGECILFGAFTCMDSYARFHKDNHQVFLGVDESHSRGAYIDILIAHELTHVARESRASVWDGFGLSPVMTHDELTANLPVIEHLFREGFSCAVSEILHPGEDPCHYAYQTTDSIEQVIAHGPALDRQIKLELRKEQGDYSRLYNPNRYGRNMPAYSHYVWSWQWTKALIQDFGSDPTKILTLCSQEFMDHALSFKLKAIR